MLEYLLGFLSFATSFYGLLFRSEQVIFYKVNNYRIKEYAVHLTDSSKPAHNLFKHLVDIMFKCSCQTFSVK